MEYDRFETWLDAYKQVWESRDPDAAAALFTEDATYQETPFDEPIAGRDAIRNYWLAVPEGQSDIRFRASTLAVDGDTGIARWQCSFRRTATGTKVDLDGIFLIVLTENDLCQRFQEWWHRQELPVD